MASRGRTPRPASSSPFTAWRRKTCPLSVGLLAMSDYTFEQLSPNDFELLVRDLLQAELEIRLENFTAGRDRGIDLRYATDERSTLIVQCKHYLRSTWTDLQRSIRADVPKVVGLAPQRYVVATSVRMTPGRKQWILQTCAPYIKKPEDVVGPEDLNNLLSRHPDVEKSHFKLWLTSVPVLQRVLHSEIFSGQEAEIDSLKRRVCRFVSNPSVARAQKILSEQRFCLITGVPGIGKTTLAEMLVIDHLEREFECFSILDDLGQARKVWRRNTKQLFYYDDFLGRTGLHAQFDKNEDERLRRFIEDVVASQHTRLILTTREYILNQARWVLEALQTIHLTAAQCVVSLADYTSRIRATILYNHLYYSGLPHPHVESFVRRGAHRNIVRHPNYNPRLIEVMTDVLNVRDLSADEYPDAFLDNLDNPKRLWEVAYDSHLSVAAQNLLLVMITLPDRTVLDDAEEAFEAFHRPRTQRYGQVGAPYDWNRALKELEGNFVGTKLNHGNIIIQFHNPSIRDFLEGRLCDYLRDTKELIEFCAFPDQLERLHEILTRSDTRSWLPQLSKRFVELYDIRPAGRTLVKYGQSGRGQWLVKKKSATQRLFELCDFLKADKSFDGRSIIERAAKMTEEQIQTEAPDRRELARLITRILAGDMNGLDDQHRLYGIAIDRAFGELEADQTSLQEFDALFDLVDLFPDIVDDATRRQVVDEFEDFCEVELDAIQRDDDPGVRLDTYDELAATAERVGIKLSVSRDKIDTEDYSWGEEEDDSRFVREADRIDDAVSDRELDDLFGSLLMD